MRRASPDPQAAFACDRPLPADVLEGLVRFNRGDFFAAHESLESAWRAERGKVRDLYHGIIQLAVAWHQIGRLRFVGAQHALARAQHWLAPFPDECRGLDVAAIRAQVEALRAEVAERGARGMAEVDSTLRRPILPSDPKGKASR